MIVIIIKELMDKEREREREGNWKRKSKLREVEKLKMRKGYETGYDDNVPQLAIRAEQ